MKIKLPFIAGWRNSLRLKVKPRFVKSFNGKKLRRRWSWKKILRVFLILVVLGILLVAALFAWYAKDLPTPGQIKSIAPDQSTILYDRNGKQLYDISGNQQRILLDSKDIPVVMKQAVVSVEDKSFYTNHGVELTGIIRGVILRPLTGQSAQGGSTITQQYVKNAILTPDRTITRKIKEIIISTEMDYMFTKDQVLTLYLNEIPFGSNAYGIEAASELYFGKSAKSGLTISQAAVLAAMVQAPTYYSPYGDNVADLMARKNLVINNMVAQKYITQAQGDQAKKDAPVAAKDFSAPQQNILAPHFVMYVKQQLVNIYGEDMVNRGGLRVTTTIDLDKQAQAETAMKDAAAPKGILKQSSATNAGMTSIDPKTGQILSMVGSVNYFDQANSGNFNTTTGLRQPGSAGKPIVYAQLFKGKYSPSSLFYDLTTNFNGYIPTDFDNKNRGPLTARTALGNSLNIPAVKALQIEGINNFIDQAKAQGITTFDKSKDYGLSIALGGAEVQLVELTNAYSVFANGGVYHPLTSILKVQDSTGKTIDEWKDQPKQVLAPEIAYEINNILSDLDAKKATYGSSIYYLSLPGRPVAAKTGTSNDYKDAWTIGYTPSVVTGVWAGNNNNAPLNHAGGSIAAAPIFREYMASVLGKSAIEQFNRPSTIIDMSVDLLSGKKPTPYSGQLVKDIFAPWQIPTTDDNVHIAVKVCTVNGLLATDSTPADQVTQKVFTAVHSEQPSLSNWEAPVLAWAKANGFNGSIPTQKCDIVASQPTISISSPSSNDTVPNVFTISADVKAQDGTTNTVTFSIDGNTVGTPVASAPYSVTTTTANLTPGNHTIAATVQSSNNQSGTTSITVNVASDTTPPGPVTNIIITPQTGGNASISWLNPSDKDLSKVIIYVSTAKDVQGTNKKEIVVTPDSTSSVTVNGLTPGTTNYITLVTVDASGNASQNNPQTTIVLP